jgi:tetratricopeptide (TPR) repeat protein
MGIAALVLAFLVLSTVAYMVIFAVRGSDAPRTASERAIDIAEQKVQEDPTSSEAWAVYVQALTAGELYGEAASAIEQAREASGDTVRLMIEEARLANTEGDAGKALTILSEAIDLAQEEKAEQRLENEEIGVTMVPASEDLIDAALLHARIHKEFERWAESIESYTLALDEDGTMSDVLVERGEVLERAGELDEAEADYLRALDFIPDFPPAVDGLNRIGATE